MVEYVATEVYNPRYRQFFECAHGGESVLRQRLCFDWVHQRPTAQQGEPLTKTVSTRITLIWLTAGLLLGVPAAARAQSFIIPYAGFDFGDDAQCPAIDNCEKKAR